MILFNPFSRVLTASPSPIRAPFVLQNETVVGCETTHSFPTHIRRLRHREGTRHNLNTISTSKKHRATLIDLLVRQVILVLPVVVVLVLGVVLLLVRRTVLAPGLVDPVIDARVADAFAAAVVEPSVTGCTHALTRRAALVPRVALGHERDRAIERHHVRFQRMDLLVRGLHVILHFLLVLRRVVGHVKVDRIRERDPSFQRIWFRG